MNDYEKTINEENEKFVSAIRNKGMFYLGIYSGAVIPITHPRYYEGRKNITLYKDIEYNHIYNTKVEIEKNKYFVDDDTFNKVIEYIKNNFNKLIHIALNQSNEMYDGVSHSINIKIGSILLNLSTLNTQNEEEREFLNKFENEIVKILSIENNLINELNPKSWTVYK